MFKWSQVDSERARDRMVEAQVVRRGISDPVVLQALRSVPREQFVDPALAEFAYEDAPLPIDEGQTISQPFIVASMIAAAEVKGGDRVLEVGAGSGYAAAVLAQIAHQVYAIERREGLAALARSRLETLGYRNLRVRTGDGTLGWPEAAPFDAILVAAAGPEVPAPLQAQLAPGGRLVMPLDLGRPGDVQQLVKVVRTGLSTFERENLGAVSFVALTGKHGWPERP